MSFLLPSQEKCCLWAIELFERRPEKDTIDFYEPELIFKFSLT